MKHLHTDPHTAAHSRPVTRRCAAATPEPTRWRLHDDAGRPIGIITAPLQRAGLGPHAPTVYLERGGTAAG